MQGRRIILLAVGALMLTAQTDRPKADQQPVNTQRASDTQQAANSIASAIRDTIRPAEKDRGCDQGQDERNSDLCAQWKAADSARDAAIYAFWTLLLSALGTGLLVWTLWETRSASRRELRAYVSVKVVGHSITRIKGKGIRLETSIIAHNGGSTPAYDCIHFGDVAAMSPDVAPRFFRDLRTIDETALEGGTVIHGGEDLPIEFPNKSGFIPFEVTDKVANGQGSIYSFGCTTYVDTFGKRRRTDWCYMLTGDEFAEAYLASDQAKKEGVTVHWRSAPFHNRAT